MNKNEEIAALKRILDYVVYQLQGLITSVRSGRMNIEAKAFGRTIKVAKEKGGQRECPHLAFKNTRDGRECAACGINWKLALSEKNKRRALEAEMRNKDIVEKRVREQQRLQDWKKAKRKRRGKE